MEDKTMAEDNMKELNMDSLEDVTGGAYLSKSFRHTRICKGCNRKMLYEPDYEPKHYICKRCNIVFSDEKSWGELTSDGRPYWMSY